MTSTTDHTCVCVDATGHPTGMADVAPQQSPPGTVRAALHVEAGHLPPGSRSQLVDAVLDLPEVRQSEHLEASVPMGDAEILDRLRQRCDHVHTRPAGATCLVEAHIPHAPQQAG